jgi:hypothetical protein
VFVKAKVGRQKRENRPRRLFVFTKPGRTDRISLMRNVNYLKLVFTLLMAFYGILCVKDLPDASLLDRVNLVAHEAGHLFFSWFGEFIHVLGGTIGQLFVPAAFTVYFFLRREFFSSAVALFWAGQNFLGISVYMKDAQAMALPLVSVGGGEDVIHDWNYILLKLGILRWDHAVGTGALSAGVVIMTASIIWAVYCSFQSPEAD